MLQAIRFNTFSQFSVKYLRYSSFWIKEHHCAYNECIHHNLFLFEFFKRIDGQTNEHKQQIKFIITFSQL